MLEINPKADIRIHKTFFLPENAGEFSFEEYDYVVDAVDTVTAKIEIIMQAKKNNIPVISCMGAGNKLDPTQFRVADIYQTKVCPLARVMRHEMKKRQVKHLKVVYSEEKPMRPWMTWPTAAGQTASALRAQSTSVPTGGIFPAASPSSLPLPD
jgi:tRNA A37 threonylcarbamoyladenosine dehydratase